MGDYSESTLLFAEPSFLLGASRILDLGATINPYNYSSSEKEADARALFSDWRATGNDVDEATRLFSIPSRR